MAPALLSAQMWVQQRAFLKQGLLSDIWAPQPALPSVVTPLGSGWALHCQDLGMAPTAPSESSPILGWKSWKARAQCVCIFWLAILFSIDSHPAVYSWPSLLPRCLTHSSVLPKSRDSDPLAPGARQHRLKAELDCRQVHSLSFPF